MVLNLELRSLVMGFLLACVLMGCIGWNYKYYGLEGASYDHGTLLGPTAKDDLPFSACAPDAASKHKCVIMLEKEFFSMKLDYEDVKMRLTACEKKASP